MAEIKKINGNTLCDDVARGAAQAATEKAGVQADWEEYDPASPAYVKNRIGGCKRSEEERKVVYDEYNAEIWDMAIGGDIMRYRKVSDTLLSVSDWIGAEIVIAGRDADGVEQEMFRFVIQDGKPSDSEAQVAGWIERIQGNVGMVYAVMTGLAGDLPCGFIIPQEDYNEMALYHKGVWALDLPGLFADGSAVQSLVNTLDTEDNFTPVTVYHKSITLAEGVMKRIPAELVDIQQANWEETDSGSTSYIKGRPFGPATHILPEQKVKGQEAPGYSGNYVSFDGILGVEGGVVGSVTAVFDGKRYELKHQVGYVSGWGNITVGHYEGTGIVWDGQEPPFWINDKLDKVYLNDAAEHTISVESYVYKRLDPWCVNLDEIEESIDKATKAANTQSDWNEESTTAVGYIKNRPFYQTKFIVPRQEFSSSDWEEVGNGHYRAKPLYSFGPNAIATDKAYSISGTRFNTWGLNYTGYVYMGSLPQEIAPFGDDYTVTVSKYLVHWSNSAAKLDSDIVYIDGYLYARSSGYRLKEVSISTYHENPFYKKIDPVYLPYTAGSGIAISDTGEVSADTAVLATKAGAEDWTFTLESGETVTKKVVLG